MPEGANLGRYRVGEKIGEGGMAEVFRAALDGAEGFSRPLVVKRVRRELAAEPAIARMFVDEARLAQRLRHGGIVQIHDFGLDDAGTPYLVMEQVDGVSLEALLERTGRLEVADALHIVERVAEALSYAHRLRGDDGAPLGLVHRDVTPRNVLVSTEGVVKLADFGIAKTAAPARTIPGLVKGSVGYLSPEQAAGAPVDARTDQFALGVVLYELLSGANPYREVTNLERVRVTLERPLAPLPRERGIDEDLDAIVRRATAFAPGARYESIDELHAELQEWRVSRGYRSSEERIAALVARRPRQKPAAIGDLPLRATVPAAPAKRPRTRVWLALPIVAAIAALVVWRFFPAPPSAPPGDPPPAPAATPAQPRSPAPSAETPTPTPTSTSPPAPAPRPRPRPATAVAPPSRLPDGRLKINLVPYAIVTLDGVELGSTPIDRPVSAGAHSVVLENPDLGRKRTVPIQVEPDALVEITRW